MPELLHVIGVDLGDVFDLARIAPVVRHAVVSSAHCDVGIGEVAALASHHERCDAREVGLEGQHHEIEHEPGMVRVVSRNALRARHFRLRRPAVPAGGGDPLLHLPHA